MPVAAYGYRSVDLEAQDQRPYGRISRYNQEKPAVVIGTVNISNLDVDFDLAGSDFSPTGVVTQTVDWGDSSSDEQFSDSDTAFAHSYSADGTYTITVTIVDSFGFTDVESVEVTVAGV